MASFKAETEQRPGEVLVRLTGEFDILAFDDVDGLLTAAQTDNDHVVVVDLRALDFIDSSGIRALVRAHKRAEAAGGQFRLIRGAPEVHRVFELAGLDERLVFSEAEGP